MSANNSSPTAGTSNTIFLGIKGVQKTIKNKFASIAKDKGMLQAALFEEIFLYYLDSVLGIKFLDVPNSQTKDNVSEP